MHFTFKIKCKCLSYILSLMAHWYVLSNKKRRIERLVFVFFKKGMLHYYPLRNLKTILSVMIVYNSGITAAAAALQNKKLSEKGRCM